MNSIKLSPGQLLPNITVSRLEGGEMHLSKPNAVYGWRLIVVYRGKHCPICTNYLSKLNELLPEFHKIGVDVVAVSADTLEKAQTQTTEINPGFDVGYDLAVEQMKDLGLYISTPRSAAETDRPFAEPALFVVNKKSELQVIDISNAPFSRPELTTLLKGLNFILNPSNNYPVRGTL